MRVGTFFAPTAATPAHIARAEALGFDSAWCYDSPLLYADPFVTLARAAERTHRIRLGVGVLVPGLRTPVATAAALRTLSGLAPGRLAVCVGAGFTGRFTLGLPPVSLARLEREVADLRALARGDEVTHPEGGRPVRPIPVAGSEGSDDHAALRIYVACRGPRAQALAARAGDAAMSGVLYPGGLPALRASLDPRLPLAVHAVAAVAEPDEPLDSPRLGQAVGPVVAVAFHAFVEQPWRLAGLPDGLRAQARAYAAAIAARLPAPSERRHQHLHRGHLVRLELPEDRALVSADHVRRFALCGTVEELRARRASLAAEGVAELLVQPGGDPATELPRLAEALL